MALIAWPAANANSYVAKAAADAYFADDVRGAVWYSFSETLQGRALVTATRLIDRNTFTGTKTAEDQPLAFPRVGVTDINGEAVEDDAIPGVITVATLELAYVLATKPAVASNPATGSSATNIKRVKAGSAEVEFFGPQSGAAFPDYVMALLSGFLASALSGETVIGFYQSGAGVELADDDFSLSQAYN